jgi:hypothetical protein
MKPPKGSWVEGPVHTGGAIERYLDHEGTNLIKWVKPMMSS